MHKTLDFAAPASCRKSIRT